ncbi:LD-carboxypeptidase [Brochothrix campestris]|uniref:Peptidase u61 ld-carboxypeptidase a n=1 Tax=Brochothrix campestris FSL F6-1037 TaxID=1265861 RepID=W7CZF4_9LIST|nr:LD-carboxypeptidase [Brochothrix campestris]EUJ41146.1 peptidase u61 ld-carboxypeptidase a [Brochothrix campestris FSL F6-1037]
MKHITLWSPANTGAALSTTAIIQALEVLNEGGFEVNIPQRDLFKATDLGVITQESNRNLLRQFNQEKDTTILMSLYGGYTSNLLLDELLHFDKATDKCLCGKSDLTCLLNGLFFLHGIKSIYGIDFAKFSNQNYSKAQTDQFIAALRQESLTFSKAASFNDGFWYIEDHLQEQHLALPWGVIGNPNIAQISGTAVGGNLESLNTLIGTSIPLDFEDKVVVLEGISNSLPAKFMMDLKHLLMTTNIEQARALVIGTFEPRSQLNEVTVLERIFKEELRCQRLPLVITNVDVSHTEPSVPFYIGGEMTLDLRSNTLSIQW